MAFSDLEILARILLCEAGGEGENGMKAVACVVMNRVQITYGEYGRLQKTNLGFALWYFNPFMPTCRQMFPSNVGRFVIRIGDHCFYNPTEQYANT